MYEKSLGSVYQYQLFVLVIGWFRYQVSERYLRNILFFELKGCNTDWSTKRDSILHKRKEYDGKSIGGGEKSCISAFL